MNASIASPHAGAPSAAPAPPSPAHHCDFCHRTLGRTESFHRLLVGLNAVGAADAPPYEDVTEEASELVSCSGCIARVEPLLDEFLEHLWRGIDPVGEIPPPPASTAEPVDAADHEPETLPEPPCADELVPTPFGSVTVAQIAAGMKILQLAEAICPPATGPEGVLFGLSVQRLCQAGLGREDIVGMLDHLLGILARVSPSSASA